MLVSARVAGLLLAMGLASAACGCRGDADSMANCEGCNAIIGLRPRISAASHNISAGASFVVRGTNLPRPRAAWARTDAFSTPADSNAAFSEPASGNFFAAPASIYPSPAHRRPLSIGDVILMSRQGDRDDTIIDVIDRSDAIFHLSAEDENRLRGAGVTENVIRKMQDSDRR